ncbi:MAG: hypothetical protein HUU55_13830 [Myxococcales bacterium]|nr:hypothetical protein [Myxococcales bacterium]
MRVRFGTKNTIWLRSLAAWLITLAFCGHCACGNEGESGQFFADSSTLLLLDGVISIDGVGDVDAGSANDGEPVFGGKDTVGTLDSFTSDVSDSAHDSSTDVVDAAEPMSDTVLGLDNHQPGEDGVVSDVGNDISDMFAADSTEEIDETMDSVDAPLPNDLAELSDIPVTDGVTNDDGTQSNDVADTIGTVDATSTEDVPPVPCVKETTGCVAPPVYGPATHITLLQVGKLGYIGESLDLDPENGPLDCAPVDYCEMGIDNALSSFGELSNGPLQDLFSDGDIILLVEAPQGLFKGGSFPLNGYIGKKAPNQSGCNIQTDVCEYVVTSESFGCLCEPVIHFADAWWADTGWLTTGEGTFSLAYPITKSVVIQVTLYRARLVAQATIINETIVLQNGVVAGALRPEQLAAAIEAWPGEDLGGFSKTLILAFINGLLTDIDTDNDGVDDSVSIGLKLQSVGAKIVPP